MRTHAHKTPRIRALNPVSEPIRLLLALGALALAPLTLAAAILLLSALP